MTIPQKDFKGSVFEVTAQGLADQLRAGAVFLFGDFKSLFRERRRQADGPLNSQTIHTGHLHD